MSDVCTSPEIGDLVAQMIQLHYEINHDQSWSMLYTKQARFEDLKEQLNRLGRKESS